MVIVLFMGITQEQYEKFVPFLPVQCGDCDPVCGKWRGLPKQFGNWHTIYTRMNRWAKRGVLATVFDERQRNQIIQIKMDAVSLDSRISCGFGISGASEHYERKAGRNSQLRNV